MSFQIHRLFSPRVQRWVARCAQEGIQVIFSQAYRPIAYQQELWDCWHDPTNDFECRKRRKIVVRPAKPGTSFHNCAEAVDADIYPIEKFSRAVEIAEEEGIYWGGYFKTPDRVHWDNRLNLSGETINEKIRLAMSEFSEQDLVPLVQVPIIRGGPLWTGGR